MFNQLNFFNKKDSAYHKTNGKTLCEYINFDPVNELQTADRKYYKPFAVYDKAEIEFLLA